MPRSRQRATKTRPQRSKSVDPSAAPHGSPQQPVVQRRPPLSAAFIELGDLLRGQQRWQDAIDCYQQAAAIDPHNAAVWLNCGVAHRMLGQLLQAEKCYLQALELQPELAEAHANLGSVRRHAGMSERAVDCLQRAVQLRPASPEIHFNLANALSDCGHFDLARAHYRRSLALRPRRPSVLYNLGQITRFEPHDPEIADLESLASNSRLLTADDRAYVGFALGKAYNDLERFDDAFQQFAQANALVRPAFDRPGHQAFIDRVITAFPAGLFAARRAWGDSTDRPVFIVGMPRSGTTLVEQVVGNHPRVMPRGERREVQQLVDELDLRVGMDPGYPESVALLDEKLAADLAHRYRTAVDRPVDGVLRFTDKMPTNYLHLGLIAVLFPAARIVHCRRDPRDVCLSCFQQHFERRLSFAYDLDDLVIYYREYERLMSHWRRLLPNRICEIRYEDLVRAPAATARELIEFSGLDWDERCLEFNRSHAPVQTASQWQVRQPLYRSSIGRWRNYRDHIGPLLQAFGDADQVLP